MLRRYMMPPLIFAIDTAITPCRDITPLHCRHYAAIITAF